MAEDAELLNLAKRCEERAIALIHVGFRDYDGLRNGNPALDAALAAAADALVCATELRNRARRSK